MQHTLSKVLLINACAAKTQGVVTAECQPRCQQNIHLQIHIQAASIKSACNWSMLWFTRTKQLAQHQHSIVLVGVRTAFGVLLPPLPSSILLAQSNCWNCLFQRLETAFCSRSCIMQKVWRKVLAAGLHARMSHSNARYRSVTVVMLTSSCISTCRFSQAK